MSLGGEDPRRKRHLLKETETCGALEGCKVAICSLRVDAFRDWLLLDVLCHGSLLIVEIAAGRAKDDAWPGSQMNAMEHQQPAPPRSGLGLPEPTIPRANEDGR